MAKIEKEVIITGYSNVTKEGIVFQLNQKAKLKTGSILCKEFYVSWDKIGEALFQDYCNVGSVEHCDKLRSVS